jgi:hypothetical protein
MPGKSTDKDVTVTKPTGESRTFGPMPTFDAVVAAAAAQLAGHGATVRPTAR